MGSSFAAASVRQTLLTLALLALALKVFAPPGYMLVAGEHGATVVMCTEHGAMEVALPLGEDAGDQPEAAPDHPCVFAVAQAAALPGPGQAIAAPLSSPFAAPPPAREAAPRPGAGLAAPPPPATAPPTLI
jgi:hypothetical protein